MNIRDRNYQPFKLGKGRKGKETGFKAEIGSEREGLRGTRHNGRQHKGC